MGARLLPTFIIAIAIAGVSTFYTVDYRNEIFYAVSPSNGSEKFYLKLKQMGAKDERSQLREDAICAAILKSPFFSVDHEIEMLDPKNTEEFRRSHPANNWHVFKKPYEKVNVSVLQTITEEEVFPCFAKSKGTNEVKLYLVSHEYDFDRWMHRRAVLSYPEARGRFVFEYDQARKMACLLAVAEPPADGDYYHLNMLRDRAMTSKRSRAICEFTTGRKIRMCSVGLSYGSYRNEITFLPQESSIEPQCEKKEFPVYSYATSSDSIRLWVIGCKAQLTGNQTFATYYLSLGYGSYQILILPKSSDKEEREVHRFYSHLGKNNHKYNLDYQGDSRASEYYSNLPGYW